MRVTGGSDIGKVRDNNEDSYAFGKLENAVYGVVCDGMGGAVGGEIASKLGTEEVEKQINNSYSKKMKSSAIKRMMISAVTAANSAIYDYSVKNGMQGMGSTVVAVIVKDDVAHIAFDGDSRAYLIRDKITQLTVDHTYLQALYKAEKISREELESDPRKNIITRALGVDKNIEVDYTEADIEQGDIILLCSDGLTNFITDKEICEICVQNKNGDIPALLIKKANDNGGRDNITAVLIINQED